MFSRLSHLWLDAGYNGKGKGKGWVDKALGLSVEVVRPPRRWVRVPEGQERSWSSAMTSRLNLHPRFWGHFGAHISPPPGAHISPPPKKLEPKPQRSFFS